MTDIDTTVNRVGEWMHTASGGRFYPLDPLPSEIFIEDIANGLALDCRYAGQGRVDRFYSVAEHCVLMAAYIMRTTGNHRLAFGALMHDAPEAYLNDLPRAVKHAVGSSYAIIEDRVMAAIKQRFPILQGLSPDDWALIKTTDRRIVPLEKAAIMAKPQPWAYDQWIPLAQTRIECWAPPVAYGQFLAIYHELVCTLAERNGHA